jgi:hypothetical protein
MALEMPARRNNTPRTYFVIKQLLAAAATLVKAIIHQTTAILASLVTISRLIRLSLLRKDRNAFFSARRVTPCAHGCFANARKQILAHYRSLVCQADRCDREIARQAPDQLALQGAAKCPYLELIRQKTPAR